MTKHILLIALVLSKWPLIADTQIQEPSLAGKLLSDGRVCSDWPISAFFPDFCAFAFYRCILKKYFLKTFRCPGVTTQKTTDPQATNQEAFPEANILSILQSMAEPHDTITTAATATESLPVLLSAISTSPVAKAEVSSDLSPTNTVMSTTVETFDIAVTPITATAQSLLEHHALNMLESLPELPTIPDAVVTTTPLPEPLIATPAATTAVPSTSLHNTTTADSTTSESSSEPLASASTTRSFSRLTAIISAITSASPPSLVSTPIHSKKTKADNAEGITSPEQNSVRSPSTQQHEESTKPSKEKLTAGHLESQVSLVTLSGQPQEETPRAQQHPLPDINLRDLFLRLQDSQVQHLIQEAQDLLAKGKGKQKQDLQATSLQLLRALNLANRQRKAKLGSKIKPQEQA